MRHPGRIVACGIVLSWFGAAGWAGDPQADFEALFGAEAKKVAASGSTADAVAFAAKLLKAARSTTDSPAFQVLAADKACQFGLKASAGYRTSAAALDLLQALAPERKVEWLARKCQLLKVRGAASRGEAAEGIALEYLDCLMAYAEEAADRGKGKEAEEAYQTAAALAKKLESPRREEALAGLQWVADLAETQRKADALKAKMEKNPNDAAARAALVLILVVEMDSPVEAAKLLTNDMDEAVRTYVTLAARKLADVPPQACLELGQWYGKTLAKDAAPAGKAIVLGRAKGYYEHFLSAQQAKDLNWLKAKSALDDVEKQLAALPRRGRPVPTSGPSVSLIRGLLLYLPFDRVDRTATPDAGPRGHHVRVQGATIARGRIGGGCQFDGRNDCLAVSDNANLNPTAAISIAAWIKADSWDGNARIVQKGAWNSQYRLLRENGVLTFHLAGVSDGEVGCETPGSGAWHHVAGVYDGKTIRLYVDGQERGSKTASGRIAVTRDLLYVATRTSNAIQTDHFKGILDELRIYDRALSVREVELLSQAGGEKRTE